MRFKISGIYSRVTEAKRHSRILRAHRAAYCLTMPVKKASSEQERIRLSSLFEIAELPAPPKQKKRRIRAAAISIFNFFARIGALVGKAFTFVGRGILAFIKRLVPLSRPRSLSMLLGALCAALSVTIVSALTVGTYLLSVYFLPYEEFVIPDILGHQLTDVTELYGDRVELSIRYVHSAEHPSGTVIGQYPSSGIVKKQYSSSPLSPMSVTVSLGTKTYRVDSLAGKRERDALMILRENEVITNISKEYSDTVPAGNVISTVPAADALIKEGDTVTLRVSLGKKIKAISVPDLYNLTESGACLAIEERGLTVGNISYEESSLPAGRVIAQFPAPFESLKEGEAVSFTVSAGGRFATHSVPDLYGMTVEQARQKLREVGIVVGTVYSVSSGAPSGTVVAQSPIPSSPIVSSITSVDLYISS